MNEMIVFFRFFDVGLFDGDAVFCVVKTVGVMYTMRCRYLATMCCCKRWRAG